MVALKSKLLTSAVRIVRLALLCIFYIGLKGGNGGHASSCDEGNSLKGNEQCSGKSESRQGLVI